MYANYAAAAAVEEAEESSPRNGLAGMNFGEVLEDFGMARRPGVIGDDLVNVRGRGSRWGLSGSFGMGVIRLERS